MPASIDAPLPARPATGYVYETSWSLATGDVDQRLDIRLDGVARHIQEVGAENLLDAGEAEAHPYWIVNRTVIDVREPLRYPNEIRFSRWCSALSTRWCTMRVDLRGSAGGLIETEGFWIAINKDTLTPMRVSDSLVAKFASTTDEHRVKWRPLLGPPGPDGDVCPYALRRTDIDLFGHVTNTAYWHAVHEVTARHPDICDEPYRAVVEYRRPIAYGEDVTLVTDRDGDEVRAALRVGDEVRALVLLRSR